MNDISLAIFDITGTTVQDEGEVAEAFTAALDSCGIVVNTEQIRAVRGMAKLEAVGRLVERKFGENNPQNDIRIQQTYATFCQILRTRYAQEGVHLIPGLLDTFTWLHKQNIQIALNSGFERTIVDAILENIDWGDLEISTVVCGDEVAQGRPAPYMIFRVMEQTGITSVHRILVAGDTARDLEAGYQAGVRYNIGVLSGAHGRAQLEQAPHTHILASVADLPTLLEIGVASVQ